MTGFTKSVTRVQTRRALPKRRLLGATASGQTLAAAPKISVMKSPRFITFPMHTEGGEFSAWPMSPSGVIFDHAADYAGRFMPLRSGSAFINAAIRRDVPSSD
jgi:hypothetical protein